MKKFTIVFSNTNRAKLPNLSKYHIDNVIITELPIMRQAAIEEMAYSMFEIIINNPAITVKVANIIHDIIKTQKETKIDGKVVNSLNTMKDVIDLIQDV